MTIEPAVAKKILGVILKALYAASKEIKEARAIDSDGGRKLTKAEVSEIVQAAFNASVGAVVGILVDDKEG